MTRHHPNMNGVSTRWCIYAYRSTEKRKRTVPSARRLSNNMTANIIPTPKELSINVTENFACFFLCLLGLEMCEKYQFDCSQWHLCEKLKEFAVWPTAGRQSTLTRCKKFNRFLRSEIRGLVLFVQLGLALDWWLSCSAFLCFIAQMNISV